MHKLMIAAAALALLIMPGAERAAAAQTGAVSQAPPGSPTRRSILGALRPAVERRLGRGVEFAVDRIEIEDGWALVIAQPQRTGGRMIDPSDFFSAEELEFMDGLTVSAVLRQENRRWSLVDHRIGATDVWYCNAGSASFLQC